MNEFETITKKSCYDPTIRATVGIITFKTDRNQLGFAVVLPDAGICRSRPAFSAAVVAAADSIWNTTYHALFGEEAARFIPASLFAEYAERSEEHE